MSSLPWMKFEVSSWLIDTRVLSAEAKGVWIDILASMWQQLGRPNSAEPGTMTKTVGELARLTGVSPETMLRVIREFEDNYICDVTWHVTPDVTPDVTSLVTMLSRRMSREQGERDDAAERKRRSRSPKNYDGVSRCKSDDLQNVTEMSQPCHATEESRVDENKEEEKKKRERENALAPEESSTGVQDLTTLSGATNAILACNPAWNTHRIRVSVSNALQEYCKVPEARGLAVSEFIDELNCMAELSRDFDIGRFRGYLRNAGERQKLSESANSSPYAKYGKHAAALLDCTT